MAKPDKEAIRNLKRHLFRRVYNLLKHQVQTRATLRLRLTSADCPVSYPKQLASEPAVVRALPARPRSHKLRGRLRIKRRSTPLMLTPPTRQGAWRQPTAPLIHHSLT